MKRWLLIAALTFVPATAGAQSASEVERCFQNPAGCSTSGSPPPPPPTTTAARPAAAPDYTSVLQSSDAERRKIQESLRTLDKYSGPIDGDLQSGATTKAISDWQKDHGYPQAGKLTPQEAQTLHAEAAKAPIKRLDPTVQTAATTPPPSNADTLKALEAKLAERRKAAEPKAKAAADALIKDLKAYIAADGKGVAGEQFTTFAKWYADNKTAGRTFGEVTPAVDDYGDAKSGAAATTEVKFETRQGDKTYGQCLVFAWIEGSPRKNTAAFACDDVAGVEKWKTDQALKSAWR